MRNRAALFYFFLAICGFTGCEESYTGDVFDPRLPEYSESGGNHAGAYINDRPWRAFPRSSFYGIQGEPYLWYDSAAAKYSLVFSPGNIITATGEYGADIDLCFTISEQTMAPIVDGTAEYPVVIFLDGNEGEAELYHQPMFADNDSSETCSSGSGLLHIRHARIVYEDEGQRYHLAGTFGFDIDDSCGRYKVRSGRFDFRFRCRSGICN